MLRFAAVVLWLTLLGLGALVYRIRTFGRPVWMSKVRTEIRAWALGARDAWRLDVRPWLDGLLVRPLTVSALYDAGSNPECPISNSHELTEPAQRLRIRDYDLDADPESEEPSVSPTEPTHRRHGVGRPVSDYCEVIPGTGGRHRRDRLQPGATEEWASTLHFWAEAAAKEGADWRRIGRAAAPGAHRYARLRVGAAA